MSILTILIIASAVLFVIVIGLLVASSVDWHEFFYKRVGPDYKKGVAHIIEREKSVYRGSWLIYADDLAMSYARYANVEKKDKTIVVDIVPNDIGFTFDEYTGERLYRVKPGGCIGYSDDLGGPSVDFPARLISTHVLDRTAVEYARSVNGVSGGGFFNWKLILIIIAVVGIAAGFLTGVIPNPLAQDTAAPITETTETPEEQPETPVENTGPVITEVD